MSCHFISFHAVSRQRQELILLLIALCIYDMIRLRTTYINEFIFDLRRVRQGAEVALPAAQRGAEGLNQAAAPRTEEKS